MLDTDRNHLIACAFRKANITSLESDPTPAEIEDAAHTLNMMLQSWNNDGFRLFKIHTGYMPMIPHKKEYSLATQAYKSIAGSPLVRIDKVGATKLKVSNISEISVMQKFVAVDSISSVPTVITNIDYATNEITLAVPLEFSITTTTALFYGEFFTGITPMRTFAGSFNSFSFDDYTVAPTVGDTVFFCYNGVWTKKVISLVDNQNKTISFSGSLPAGSITNPFIAFGSKLMFATPVQDYPVSPRCVVVDELKEPCEFVAIPVENGQENVFKVESCDLVNKKIYLVESIDENALGELGEERIEATNKYLTQEEVTWSDLSGIIPVTELDWGSITDSSDLQTDDWGNIADPATTLVDWGTLTGNAAIIGYSESNNIKYALVEDTDTHARYLLCYANNSWQTVDLETYGLHTYNLYTFGGKTYLYDSENGLYLLNQDVLTLVYGISGIEKIIQYRGNLYLVSPKTVGTITRVVTETKDMTAFGAVYTIELDKLDNPAEFKERLFIGKTDTFVGDMMHFMDAGVYAENRCVIGDRLMNLNTQRSCSFTLDGHTFLPMPMMLSAQTAWGSKDGCAFIAVYGYLVDGVVGTQIFTANDFNPIWTPQVIVPGRVFDIFFDDKKAYFVSDVAVFSLLYSDSIVTKEPTLAYLYGKQIGRPQSIMNTMRLSLVSLMQLPMNSLALKDFLLLPVETNGEPVNYCFFREAEDGKMMVWGTPTKFGEYLRFSYVEPITLLSDARSTPDFPDEYYEAVEDGLAAQLAAQYGAPLDRQQILEARAKESKENAMLHDNEDESYDITPNQRWL